MRIVKYVGSLALAVLLLFLFVANFSGVESRFQCSGELPSDGSSQPVTVYLKLLEYRWWVGLWSDSDASLWLEVPNNTVEYFGHVVEVGDQLQIFDSAKGLKGNFSSLSKALALGTTIGLFDGICKRIDR